MDLKVDGGKLTRHRKNFAFHKRENRTIMDKDIIPKGWGMIQIYDYLITSLIMKCIVENFGTYCWMQYRI